MITTLAMMSAGFDLDKVGAELDRELLARELAALPLVHAAEPQESWMDLHDHVRDHAQAIYQRAFDGALHENVRRAHEKGVTGLELAAFILLFDDPFERDLRLALLKAGEEAHRYTEAMLGEKKWGDPEARAKEFAEMRAKDLGGTPKLVSKRLRDALEPAIRESQSPLAVLRRLDEAARQAERVEGHRMAATESQVCYGTVLDGILMSVGYKFKRWISQRDERVRESHKLCDEQGPIKLMNMFMNGGRYPGDPNLPVEELANCRCYLKGVDK